MDPNIIKNVLSLPIMILMVLVFLAIIAITTTNTIYYKKLWDDNGSKSISEESAKVFFFMNLFLAIVSAVVFFIFLYRWYKLYNISNMEVKNYQVPTTQDSSYIPPSMMFDDDIFDNNLTPQNMADIDMLNKCILNRNPRRIKRGRLGLGY